MVILVGAIVLEDVIILAKVTVAMDADTPVIIVVILLVRTIALVTVVMDVDMIVIELVLLLAHIPAVMEAAKEIVLALVKMVVVETVKMVAAVATMDVQVVQELVQEVV